MAASTRYIVFGAGAVGGAVAALLHRADRDVLAVARGAQRDAIEAGGLRLRTPAGERRARVAVVSAADLAIEPDRDVVILAVKSQDTAAALAQLVAAGGDGAPIVCAQNGVANERACARVTDRVYGAMVWTPAVFLSPGIVECYALPHPALWVVGAWPHGADAAVAAIVDDLRDAGLAADGSDQIMRYKHAKLLDNLGNAIDALFDAGGPDDPGWRAVHAAVRAEGEAALRAAGLAWADETELRGLVDGRVDSAPIDGVVRPGGSTWQSLARGVGSLELDYLNGEICMLGALHGVPTPVNRAVLRVAAAFVRAGRRPRSATLDDLRHALPAGVLPA